jgi:carboxyl-terminal processing protease
MPRFKTAAAVALLAVPIVAGGWLLQQQPRSTSLVLTQVLDLVGRRYVDSIPAQDVYEKAARGLVEQLNDPYSELMSPKENADFNRNVGGRYGGTGMMIGVELDKSIVVDRVFPDTPAEAAGVLEGDRIMSVDGKPMTGVSLDTVSSMLKGDPGTNVTVTYARRGMTEPLVYKLKRAEIHIPAVEYSTVLGDHVGYIPLQQFNENAADEVTAAVKSLKAAGAKSLILDLRDNPGGLVDQALTIASLFLKDNQLILSVRTRDGTTEVDSVKGPHLAGDLPLLVMVDDGSASASEIVAGALQDHDRALILGTTSFGKGLVQSVYGLSGGYTLKITTGKWLTPSGRSIHRDRKLLPDGRLVEVQPDSLETDSVRKLRPAFKSDGGRTVYGGGGITPDVILSPDTLSTAEQLFTRSLAPKAGVLNQVLRDYSGELKSTVKAGFTPSPAWTPELFRRLQVGGLTIDPKDQTVASKLLGRNLELQVARQALGAGEVRKRTVVDDRQLARAVQLLTGVTSEQQLLASVVKK